MLCCRLLCEVDQNSATAAWSWHKNTTKNTWTGIQKRILPSNHFAEPVSSVYIKTSRHWWLPSNHSPHPYAPTVLMLLVQYCINPEYKSFQNINRTFCCLFLCYVYKSQVKLFHDMSILMPAIIYLPLSISNTIHVDGSPSIPSPPPHHSHPFLPLLFCVFVISIPHHLLSPFSTV